MDTTVIISNRLIVDVVDDETVLLIAEGRSISLNDKEVDVLCASLECWLATGEMYYQPNDTASDLAIAIGGE